MSMFIKYVTATQRWINLFKETRVSGVLKCLCLVCFCSKCVVASGEKTLWAHCQYVLRFPVLKISQTQRWVSGQQPCATVMFTFYTSLLGILFGLCCEMLLCTSTNILAVLESQYWHSESFYSLFLMRKVKLDFIKGQKWYLEGKSDRCPWGVQRYLYFLDVFCGTHWKAKQRQIFKGCNMVPLIQRTKAHEKNIMNEKTLETIRNNARDYCGQLFVKLLRQIKTQR